MRLPYSSFTHLCHPELIITTRFCTEYQNMPSKSYNMCTTWLPCRHTFVKLQQHNADAEKKLHWLHVKYRILINVMLLTFKALHGVARNYWKTLLQSYMPSRSETGNLLIMPKTRRKLGCHSFAYAASTLWNELPVNIRTTTSMIVS